MSAYQIEDLPERIAEKITVNSLTGCWEWTGSRDNQGYGHIKMRGRVLRVHRVVYELLVAPIPVDLPCLDHVKDWGCTTKSCCWPAHLEPVTNEENLRRAKIIPTHCPAGHKYTPESTYRPPAGGGMQCRPCKRGAPPAWTVVFICPACGHSRTGPSGRYCGDCRCLHLNTKGKRCGNLAVRCDDHVTVAGSGQLKVRENPDSGLLPIDDQRLDGATAQVSEQPGSTVLPVIWHSPRSEDIRPAVSAKLPR